MRTVAKDDDRGPVETRSSVRVDSLREAYAYVDAYPHASGPWETVSETRSSREGGTVLTVELAAPDGDRLTQRFDTSTFGLSGGLQRFGVEPTTALDALMAEVATFASANPPYHPGSLPRFPVPSQRYAGRLEVPVAILAIDDVGRPGLYAPARVVVVSHDDGRPYGIGEFPGFDPDVWPPTRLGDWPPAAVTTMPRRQLAGVVARFNGVWLRVLTAAIENTTHLQATNERAEAATLIRQLDAHGMVEVYRRLNEPFWQSVTGT